MADALNCYAVMRDYLYVQRVHTKYGCSGNIPLYVGIYLRLYINELLLLLVKHCAVSTLTWQ